MSHPQDVHYNNNFEYFITLILSNVTIDSNKRQHKNINIRTTNAFRASSTPSKYYLVQFVGHIHEVYPKVFHVSCLEIEDQNWALEQVHQECQC